MHIGIYTRISEDDELTGKGVQRQQEDCRALITRMGWTGDVVVYEENNVSATRSKSRPQFDRLMADARAGRITAIVFWDSDRITRTPREAEDVIDLATKHGVKVVSVQGDDLTTSDGQMMFRIKITVARNDIDKMKRRIRRASDQRAAEGRLAGQTGYGFGRQEDGTVYAVPEEVTVIQEAARRLLAGDSLRRVCLDFQDRGVPTPGRGERWNTTTLKQLVLRESLAGLRRHRGEVVGELHPDIPRILTVETHERLKALLSDPVRRTSPVGRSAKYLLGGIARCGKPTGEIDEAGQPVLCDGVVVRQVGRMTMTKNGGTKRQPPAYACSACFGVRRKQEQVDEYVEAVVVGRLERPDAIRLFTGGDEAAATQAREAVAVIDARLATAADQFADGILTGDQLERITTKLRGERERQEAVVRASLPLAIDPALAGEHARATWDRLDMDTKRKVLNLLVDVTILPSGAGREFDPNLVRITWH